jgi:sugar/nucleoside kinase (ribokinase family)
MHEARKAGVKVALSLSDPFCVHRHKDDFRQIIRDHVDLLFGNHEEAQALTETETAEEAIRAMTPYCDLAAVTLSAEGALLRQGDTLYRIPGFPVAAVDTTGAGDMFAAGLLYGLTQGLPLETTGRLASYVAAQVVAKLGPRLEAVDREAIARLRAD